MKIIETDIKEVIVLQPSVFPDDRGYFYEVYNNATGNKYIEANWSGYFKGITLVNDLTTFFN